MGAPTAGKALPIDTLCAEAGLPLFELRGQFAVIEALIPGAGTLDSAVPMMPASPHTSFTGRSRTAA
jgi:hypothetical protein